MDDLTYIASVEWRVAKTMPDWPHEYTVRSWRPEASEEFSWFCRLIQVEGVIEAWPPPPDRPIYHNKYLVIGDHKYWAMGPRGDNDSVADMTVINRALVERVD